VLLSDEEGLFEEDEVTPEEETIGEPSFDEEPPIVSPQDEEDIDPLVFGEE
jgi:hypothetical protein